MEVLGWLVILSQSLGSLSTLNGNFAGKESEARFAWMENCPPIIGNDQRAGPSCTGSAVARPDIRTTR